LCVLANRQLAHLYVQDPPDYQKAYDHAVKAGRIPQDAAVAKTLGIVTLERKDYQRAAQLLQESAAKRATDAEVWFYLGKARHQLKQTAEARDALQKALAMQLKAALAAEAKGMLDELK